MQSNDFEPQSGLPEANIFNITYFMNGFSRVRNDFVFRRGKRFRSFGMGNLTNHNESFVQNGSLQFDQFGENPFENQFENSQKKKTTIQKLEDDLTELRQELASERILTANLFSNFSKEFIKLHTNEVDVQRQISDIRETTMDGKEAADLRKLLLLSLVAPRPVFAKFTFENASKVQKDIVQYQDYQPRYPVESSDASFCCP